MGANAQTTVPTFVTSQVLTADQMNQSARTGVPVFADSTARDAAFGGTGEKTLAEGQLAYLEDTNVVQYYDGSSWATVGPSATPGLVTVQAETAFSAVASVTADNVFTSAYTNYRIIIRFQQSAGQLGMQFRASAVDTTANYNYQTFTSSSTTNTGARATAQAQALIGNNGGGAFWQLSTVDLTGVQLAEPTVYHSLAVRNDGAYTVPSAYTAFGNQSDSTAFDGIKILTTSGTITGSYTIYGYGKTI